MSEPDFQLTPPTREQAKESMRELLAEILAEGLILTLKDKKPRKKKAK
jgi:hypothetical protein